MKPWQVLFKQAPKRDIEAQGGSTGDDDFDNEAADDALAEEGESELEEEGDGEEDPESDDDEEHSDEEQDPDDEEEEEEEEEEPEEEEDEEPPSGFKFKNRETGDFDFKRINKVLGGDELEKRFREQDGTITRTFQELKSYKDIGAPQDLTTFKNKAGFLDRLIDTDPVVQRRVIEILQGQQGGQGAIPQGHGEIPQGVDPQDPLWAAFQPVFQTVQSINNRLLMEERRKQQEEQDRKFSQGLEAGKAKFKELIGKDMTPEQVAVIEAEMKTSNYLAGQNLVPALFAKEIQAAMSRKVVAKRVVKKNLPKVGASRRPAPTGKRKRSREEERDDLWEKHMSDGNDD